MDVIVVNGRQVIKCVHCNGSGICQHAIYQGRNGNRYEVMHCNFCGEGASAGSTSGYSGIGAAPICLVCGGKGHTVVG